MSERTPRWRGSVEPNAVNELGRATAYIPCHGHSGFQKIHKSVFDYHDWFIANHPPIKPQG